MAWKNKPSNFTLEVLKNADDHLKKIVGETLQQVVVRSPVMDGEFRASHKVTLDSPDNTYGKSIDASGANTIAEGLKVAATAKIGGLVYVQSNMRTSQPPKGYSDGGLVTSQDTYRVGMGTVDTINRNSTVQAERQAQASAQAQSANPQPIENNLRVIFVRDENEAKEMLYGPDGEKAFLYHQKRNKSKLA